MISSACIEHLDFLDSIGDVFTRFEEKNVTQSFKSLTEIPKLPELVDDGINVREEVLMILLKFHLNMFLEGNVSFCHHLASVVRRSLTFYI
jgi:hypothetical protein